MSYIVVNIFDREDDASNVHDFLRDSNLIDLNDSAIIHKDKDGKVHMKLCEQDYTDRVEITKKLMEFGHKKGVYTIDNIR